MGSAIEAVDVAQACQYHWNGNIHSLLIDDMLKRNVGLDDNITGTRKAGNGAMISMEWDGSGFDKR